MIDHVSVTVSDIARSTRFYTQVLAPLGLAMIVDRDVTVGFGKSYPELWLNLRADAKPVAENTGSHIALRARSEDAVRAFHARALAHGGRDGGAPGPRQAAMTTYFGAFVFDPDGNKIEALTFPQS